MTKIEVDESVAIAAPRSTVWQAIADGDQRARWWEDTYLVPVVRGGFKERWTAEDARAMVTRGVVRTIRR